MVQGSVDTIYNFRGSPSLIEATIVDPLILSILYYTVVLLFNLNGRNTSAKNLRQWDGIREGCILVLLA